MYSANAAPALKAAPPLRPRASETSPCRNQTTTAANPTAMKAEPPMPQIARNHSSSRYE